MVEATEFLQKNLHLGNPFVVEMIKIWHRDFEYLFITIKMYTINMYIIEVYLVEKLVPT